MHSIYHRIRALFKRKRERRPEDLPEAAKAALAAEVRLLRERYGVMVEELAAGEEPTHPHAVDAAVEASLPPLLTSEPSEV